MLLFYLANFSCLRSNDYSSYLLTDSFQPRLLILWSVAYRHLVIEESKAEEEHGENVP